MMIGNVDNYDVIDVDVVVGMIDVEYVDVVVVCCCCCCCCCCC